MFLINRFYIFTGSGKNHELNEAKSIILNTSRELI